MGTDIVPYVRPDEGRFHPVVYKALAALAVWFVLSAWIFAGNGKTDYLLTIVSGVILAAVGILAVLSLMRRARRPRADAPRDSGDFRDWASHEVEIQTGRVRGTVAAVEALLPIAAVAVGMTIFGVIAHLAV